LERVGRQEKAPTLPPSRRARARARVGDGNQRPWPADKVERWAIDRLIPYAKNARTHTDAQVGAIAASIKEWGWTTPALVGEDGGLIAGHARILAARQLGIAGDSRVPVMVAAGWSEAQKCAYVLADNQLAITGSGWGPELPRLELGELKLSKAPIRRRWYRRRKNHAAKSYWISRRFCRGCTIWMRITAESGR